MVKVIDAILAINPNAEVSIGGNSVDSIQWQNGTTPISKADIEAKQTELQTKYDGEQWKRNREAEYPSHNDCLHALLDGGDTLTELQTKRQTVKDKYPKG